MHLSKCWYDRKYLETSGLTFLNVTGPINQSYIKEINNDAFDVNRKNQILYNPKKGVKTVLRLIAAFPEFLFVPLEQFDQRELILKYRASKLYIDFGHHPGRERMPREAIACGCCVVTGVLGSAANLEDIPIPDKFKLDEHNSNFIGKFRSIVNHIFTDFTKVTKEFDLYRLEVLREPQQQEEDVRNLMRTLRSAKEV
jgi:hypothetical protein